MSSRTMWLVVVAALIVSGVSIARRPLAPPTSPRHAVFARRRIDTLSDSALADAEAVIVDNDLFRLSNAPPSVRYDPSGDVANVSLGAITAPALRPALVLKAIVGGPPWQAVIDGLPGQPLGTTARQGARFDRLTVRLVTRDSVVVQGPDTTWVLTFTKSS